MRVSFIVPLYNEAMTIVQCLGAIQAEMSQGDELIVVDNGSTDGSVELVLEFSGVKLIKSLSSIISGVRNAGARIATGDYLAFIDADCVICKNWRVSVVDSLSVADVAATGSKVDIPDDACWVEKAWFSQRRKQVERVNYINSGNLVIKRKIFEAVGRFNEELVTGEDAELCLRVIQSGSVIYENPGARSIHLDNPKTIIGFFKKQQWHGLGMFGTYRLTRVDKPLIMTVYFILSFLIATVLSVMIISGQNSHSVMFLLLFFTLSAPVLTAIFRAFQFRNAAYFFHLVALYFVYYAARTAAMLEILCKKWPT